jgi:hypothetical protein
MDVVTSLPQENDSLPVEGYPALLGLYKFPRSSFPVPSISRLKKPRI